MFATCAPWFPSSSFVAATEETGVRGRTGGSSAADGYVPAEDAYALACRATAQS
ncbi:hypothetical protein [Couchioplanes caeruleus]|uniref:Uncharacterized protein n=1 Tax=Couchioplanes caeruleus TaxID=56438 RepID=A0A3N1GCS7_9ACTN|nr:hypothetical protein [Couchioplanes caeruleus]ROP28082.1 hypothetical protein EDD30_0789 [Couchioplanes caeruleus]